MLAVVAGFGRESAFPVLIPLRCRARTDFFECAKKPAKETHPQDRLSLTGNLANARLNRARSRSPSGRRAAWPASCRPSPPRRTFARQAIKGDLTSKHCESDSKARRTIQLKAFSVCGAFCFDLRFPLGLASSVRPGAGSGGREAARAGFARRASACGAPCRGVRSRSARQGQGLSGAFLSPLSLGVQRKGLGRVTDSDQNHPPLDSRPKSTSNAKQYVELI